MGIIPWYMRAMHLLPPETAHSLARYFLALPAPSPLRDDRLRTRLGSLELPSPVGLAAGYDKNGDLYRVLSRWGMGFYVVGSATLRPRKPKPKPRLYRPREELWMLNAFGLPSIGASRVAGRLQRSKARIPILLSVAGFSLEEFRELLWISSRVKTVSGVELNMSCPLFEDPAGALELVRMAGRGWGKLVLLKLSPRHNGMLEDIAWEAGRRGVGLVVYNTIPVRTGLLGAGRGGLSGLPLYRLTLEAVKKIRSMDSRVPIVAVGGFFTGSQVLEAIEAGANAVEVLTALAFRGPLVFRKIALELLEALKKRGYSSVEEAVGYRAGTGEKAALVAASRN